MNGLSLTTAETFTGTVCFLICIFYLALLKVHRSERTTKAYMFLAITYAFQGLRRACAILAMHGVAFVGRAIDPLYIVWTFTIWVGVRAYGQKTTFHPGWLIVPAALIAWSFLSQGLDISGLWRLLPMHLTGAVFLYWASVHLWHLHREQRNLGLTVLSILFLLFALNTVIFPFSGHTWYRPYGYILASGLSLAIGMGLMLTALLDEQQELVSEMRGRKLAEEALQSERTLLRSLIDNMPDCIYAKDAEGRFILCNEAMVRRMGKTSMTEVVGKSDFDLLPLEIAQRFYADEQAIIQTGIPIINREEPLTIESGKITRWNLASNVPLLDRYGNRIGIVGIGREITDRKQVEEALKVSESKYRLLADNVNDVIFVLDMNFDITYVSPSIKIFMGYEPEQLLKQPAIATMTPASWDLAIKTISEAIEPKRFEHSEIPTSRTAQLEMRRKDGTTVWAEVMASFIRDENQRIVRILGVIRDITERKRTEEEHRILEERLQRAEKMEALGQLAGGVAHDLNNVLGVLTGYSELLLMEIPEGQRARGHVEKILQSTEKGAAIIQDLLTLARRGVTASDVINLNNIVSGFLKTPIFEKMNDYHPRVTFRTECDKNLLNIKGSSIHLEKTLINLVSNAAESIAGEGEVTIRTENRYLDKAISNYDEVKEGNYAVLTVSDTGMGIPSENIEKIFEPFYTKKTMGRSGTGLGLAIVWGTVKDHNGYIDVQTKVGEGTTFTLYFPVTREELIAQQQKVPIDQYMGNGELVLVVDDIAEQRDVASGLLTRLGYKVAAVSSGEEAVEYLKSSEADILVLDMIMSPGIDGLETYQRVLEINPKQKAILVSGFSETERVKEAQRLGAGAYVKKPYVMETIGMAVRYELSR
jgi:PAS domain S-box-containing protein